MPLAYLSSFPLRIFIGKALHCGVIFVTLLQKLQNVFQSKSLVFFCASCEGNNPECQKYLDESSIPTDWNFSFIFSVYYYYCCCICIQSSLFFVCLLYEDDDSCHRFMDFIVAWLTRNNSEPAKCQRLVISYDILNWNCVTNWSANN